jgi:formylglycine-generating enzyme
MTRVATLGWFGWCGALATGCAWPPMYVSDMMSGGTDAGGASTVGAKPSGGTNGAGSNARSATGTTNAVGGTGAWGGSATTGGMATSGGATSSGARSSGGTTSIGGSLNAGGGTSTGGRANSGGATSTGRIPWSGGTTSDGGTGGAGGILFADGGFGIGGELSFGGRRNIAGGFARGGGMNTAGAGGLNTGGRARAGGPGMAGGLGRGGRSSIVGGSSFGGTSDLAGTTSLGASAGIGCTGGLESIQSTTGLCVAMLVTITVDLSGHAGTAGTGGNSGIAGETGLGLAGESATGGSAGSAGEVGAAGAAAVAATYGIDATEVTRGQYAAWLNTTTAATISAQDSATCGWNSTFVPQGGCMTSSTVCQTNCDNHPQVCVDWCDAFAYCRGVGKRLCGKIGGGPNGYEDYANASLSEWHNACSSGGAILYPYGSTYSATTCNGSEYWGSGTSATLPVGTLTGCQAASPFAGVYDQSGNVWEWEDSCDSSTPSSSPFCRIRGGSFVYYFVTNYLTCDDGNAVNRDVVFGDVGFRCCSL